MSSRQPQKPVRDGIKVYACCDSGGYVFVVVLAPLLIATQLLARQDRLTDRT